MHHSQIGPSRFDPGVESPAAPAQGQSAQAATPTASIGTARRPENAARNYVRATWEEPARTASRRAAPVLANGVNLCRETGRMLGTSRLSVDISTVIATTYGTRITHATADNLAANLTLDLNLMFEEKLQHAIENEPYFTTELKKAIELIHMQLGIASVVVDEHHPLGTEHRDKRIEFLFDKLKNYYPERALRTLIDQQDGSDSTIRRFLATHPLADDDVNEGEKAKVIGYVKLIKQLFGQHPYFGGSVEYKQGIEDSMEYWIYHMSTLTRDPDRSIPIGKNAIGHLLLKPMADYATVENGMLPLMNQRNLGTGVAEAEWHELSKAMKKSLEGGVARFRRNRLPPGPDKHPQDHNYSLKFEALMTKAASAHGGSRDRLSTADIWSAANEDERKFLYGDIAEIPWSDAHLHGGKSFEQTYNTDINAAQLDYRHPLVTREQEVGLMNVVGMLGNILEKPEVACDKYLNEVRRKLNIPTGQEHFRIRDAEFGIDYSSEFLKNDFIGKHQAWYDHAYDNQKPIIGGMSGHTLGFLNLYRSALDNWSARNPGHQQALAAFPSLETFRGILLAALVGNKRHHSYDEVMAASVGAQCAADPGPGLAYDDRVGYRDILESSDPVLGQCARRAAAGLGESYLSLNYDTVLRAIELNRPGLGDHLGAPIKDYAAALSSGDAAQVRAAKQQITAVLERGLGDD